MIFSMQKTLSTSTVISQKADFFNLGCFGLTAGILFSTIKLCSRITGMI